MAEVKRNCIFLERKCGKDRCRALNRLYCEEEERCAFYKTAAQEMAREFRELAAKETSDGGGAWN